MFWQNVLVAVIVITAALFAAWRLPGTATRLRYLGWLKRLSGGRGPLFRLVSRREARMLRDAAASACGSCGTTPPRPPGPDHFRR